VLFCAIRGILGFVISQAVVFEEYSPFGVAFAVSGGGGLAGLLGAVGVALGYLRLWQLADSLKYIAGTVVAFTAVYAFRDTETGEKKFFAPIVAALALACVGFVFIAGMNFSTSAVTLFVCEIILAFSATYFYTEVFSGRDESENFSTAHSISVLAFMATVLLGFSGVRLVGGLSVGRFAAMAAVLLAGYSGGFGAGAAAGVTMGLVFDISGGGGFYSMSYGLCGLAAAFRLALSESGAFHHSYQRGDENVAAAPREHYAARARRADNLWSVRRGCGNFRTGLGGAWHEYLGG